MNESEAILFRLHSVPSASSAAGTGGNVWSGPGWGGCGRSGSPLRTAGPFLRIFMDCETRRL
jgi:hypothetical protein